MSMDNFLSFLQQILTMVEPENASSVASAKAALIAVFGLAKSSGKADAITIRSMMIAEREFEYLVSHWEEFTYHQKQNRKRLIFKIISNIFQNLFLKLEDFSMV